MAGEEILIVGGSLAGLTLALACASKGIRSRVLERAHGQHRDGGALAVDRSLLMRIIGLEPRSPSDLASFPVLTDFRRASSWQAIHHWLRELAQGRNEITLVDGVTIARVEQSEMFATAITVDGLRIDAPLIVGADGHRSLVRCAVNPDQPDALYAGYLLWRGLVRESDLPRATCWPELHDGVVLVSNPGFRLVAFPVAGLTGSLEQGERLISFAWYDPTRQALLQELKCLSATGRVLASMARESIPKSVRVELRDLAFRIWPDPWRAAIVHALEGGEVFGTPVAEYSPTRLHRGRLAILGDAAHLVSPATGQGFIAGILDAEALSGCLEEALRVSGGDIRSALSCYAGRRLRQAQALTAASVEWSRAYLAMSKEPDARRQPLRTAAITRRLQRFVGREK